MSFLKGEIVFRALRHRNLRLFLAGQLFSLVGSWMQMVAGSWLVYRLTDSAFLLGVFAFALNVPTLIFSPLAGVAADRFDRRHLLVLVNTLAMVQAFILWLLVVTGMVQVWHLMALSISLGILNAYELPARQSFISQLIEDPNDLSNAIALHSSVFNGSRLIGPAVAGALISMVGEGTCFLLNAVSFLPVILLLCMMRFQAGPLAISARVSVFSGFQYVNRSVPIRLMLMMVAVLSLMSGAFQALAPVFAREVFKGGPGMLGLLLSSSGLGALLGAIYLAVRRTVIGLGRVVALAGIGTGAAYMFFSLVRDIRIGIPAAFLCGFFIIVSIGGMNVIIQTLVDEEMRGRVMSVYGVALVGISPFGSILAGAFAARQGPTPALFMAGLIGGTAMVWFWFRLPRFRAHVRPVYVQKGIIPEA